MIILGRYTHKCEFVQVFQGAPLVCFYCGKESS